MATSKVQFTPEEVKQMQGAALAVWEECAYDILQATAEEKGKSIDAVTVSRAVAIEIALDAGRMEDRLRRQKVPAEFLERIDKADYQTLIRLVKPAFPFTRYGT